MPMQTQQPQQNDNLIFIVAVVMGVVFIGMQVLNSVKATQ